MNKNRPLKGSRTITQKERESLDDPVEWSPLPSMSTPFRPVTREEEEPLDLRLSISTACCCSVAQPCPTLWPHGLQHTRLPCPSLFPRACSNSCPLNRWCHPTISSSITPFSSRPQSTACYPVANLGGIKMCNLKQQDYKQRLRY